MAELVELVALSLLPLPRWRGVAEALRGKTPPLDILLDHCEQGAALPRVPGWADRRRLLDRAAAACQRASDLGVDAIGWADDRYPARLAAITDPPPVLWALGQTMTLERASIALVGSRAATPYAVTVAERLAADLSAAGVSIVSGLARGVDCAAHMGALSGPGGTIAVVGSGVDVVYPAEHRLLASAIRSQGILLSELCPGTQPRPEFFPRRNRLISGLAVGVVVVEAGERSGSLITARCALEQGRDVMAVPGNILGRRNTGGHALLRDGARLVESAADILDEAGLACAAPCSGTGAPTCGPDPVLDAISPGEAEELADISVRSGLPAHQVLARLLELELAGRVRRVPGGRFVRLDRTC
jgi:DNA processing protein